MVSFAQVREGHRRWRLGPLTRLEAEKHMPHTLPPLPYPSNALEPHIDARTMEIHHGKHHQAYVTNLNTALEKAPEFQDKPLEQLLAGLNKVPDALRTAVRNNGGGHWNHSLFWELMGPKAGGTPSGKLADAIKSSFGDFEKFKEQFAAACFVPAGLRCKSVQRALRDPRARSV